MSAAFWKSFSSFWKSFSVPSEVCPVQTLCCKFSIEMDVFYCCFQCWCDRFCFFFTHHATGTILHVTFQCCWYSGWLTWRAVLVYFFSSAHTTETDVSFSLCCPLSIFPLTQSVTPPLTFGSMCVCVRACLCVSHLLIRCVSVCMSLSLLVCLKCMVTLFVFIFHKY